jgi:hypothetical protein
MSPSPTPDSWTFETLTAQIDGAVLFAEISAPPMNLLGPTLVRAAATTSAFVFACTPKPSRGWAPQ